MKTKIKINVNSNTGLLNELFVNEKRFCSWSYSMYGLSAEEKYCYTAFRKWFYKHCEGKIYGNDFEVTEKVANRLIYLCLGGGNRWQEFLNN